MLGNHFEVKNQPVCEPYEFLSYEWVLFTGYYSNSSYYGERVVQQPHNSSLISSVETTPLTPAESADKLVLILERNDFSSGQHVDFYDV